MKSLCLCLALIAGCGSAKERDSVVARVGDEILTTMELRNQFPYGSSVQDGGERILRFVENWVQQELLYQEAVERGLDREARLQELLDQARRDVLVAALLDRDFQDREVEVTDEDISSYYYGHQDKYERAEEEIWAEHILLRERRDANALRQSLLQGDSFSDAAAQHSLDLKSSQVGGDLGYFSAAADPVLWEACQNLALETISKPVETEHGYHIIRVLSRKEAGTVKELESVRSQIVEALVMDDYRKRLEELTLRLKSQSSWHIDAERLAAVGS